MNLIDSTALALGAASGGESVRRGETVGDLFVDLAFKKKNKQIK